MTLVEIEIDLQEASVTFLENVHLTSWSMHLSGSQRDVELELVLYF